LLIKEKKIKEAHNPEVAGSNPAPATMKTRLLTGFLFVDLGRAYNPMGGYCLLKERLLIN